MPESEWPRCLSFGLATAMGTPFDDGNPLPVCGHDRRECAQVAPGHHTPGHSLQLDIHLGYRAEATEFGAIGVCMMRKSVRRSLRRGGNVSRLASLCAALALAMALGLLVLRLAPGGSSWSRHSLVLISLMALALVGALVVGDIRRILLLSLVLGIPLNLAFSPLGDVPYRGGGASDGVILYPYDFPLIGLVAMWWLDALSGRRPVRFSGMDVAAISLIIWSALSICNSSSARLSVFEIVRMAKLYLLSRVVAASVRTKRDMQDVLIALLVGLMGQGVIGLLQYTIGTDLGLGLFTVGELRRVSGTIGWPNTFGTYAATIVCVAFPLWLGRAGMRSRIAVGAMCAAGFVPVILSFSRGAWFALLPGLVTAVLLCWHKGWLDARSLARLAVLGLCAVVVGVFFGSSVVSRLTEVSVNMPVIVSRVQLNRIALKMIAAHPLLGVGINTFVEEMWQYDMTGVTELFPEPVHNVYLLVASETGLVGLGLFLLLLASAFREGLQAVRTGDRFTSVCAIGLLAGFVVLAVSNVADEHLRTEVLYALFWLLIGLVAAARRPLASTALHGFEEGVIQLNREQARGRAQLPDQGSARSETLFAGAEGFLP